MPKKKNNALKQLGNIGLGLGKAGVGLGVSGAVVGRMATVSPQVAPISGSIVTVARAAPIAATTMAGGTILESLRQLNKPKRRRK